eukprot:scaffold50906_cov56-Phaeocystis_antarctica.AAC.1
MSKPCLATSLLMMKEKMPIIRKCFPLGVSSRGPSARENSASNSESSGLPLSSQSRSPNWSGLHAVRTSSMLLLSSCFSSLFESSLWQRLSTMWHSGVFSWVPTKSDMSDAAFCP